MVSDRFNDVAQFLVRRLAYLDNLAELGVLPEESYCEMLAQLVRIFLFLFWVWFWLLFWVFFAAWIALQVSFRSHPNASCNRNVNVQPPYRYPHNTIWRKKSVQVQYQSSKSKMYVKMTKKAF